MLGIFSRRRKPLHKQNTVEESVKSVSDDSNEVSAAPLEQKIHPDLDALAAELEKLPRTTCPHAQPSSATHAPGPLALTPATRPREHRPQPSTSRTPLSPDPAESSVSVSTTSSHETRPNRLLTRLKNFGQRNPPSAWSTFGRKTVREVQSVPHLTDFGAGGTSQFHSRPGSSSTSHHSHSHAGTRPETPSSTWNSSPVGGDGAGMNNTFGSASSPSSAFTFGSRSNSQSPVPPVPPIPPLHNLKQPRTSASMPSMSDTRPMAQDIFPSPASQQRARRRRRRQRSGSADSKKTSTPPANSSKAVLGSPFIWSGMSTSAKGKEPQLSSSSPIPLPAASTEASTSTSAPSPANGTPNEKVRGKRKADEVEAGGSTPPDHRKEKTQHRATFAEDVRPHRASAGGSSHAPSSYHRKRARLTGQTYSSSGTGTIESRPESRTESYSQGTNALNTGSGASRISRTNSISQHLFRSQSRSSHTPGRPPSRSGSTRRPASLSQASIPISALISPHAPSISHHSAVFHMRDPRRPAPIQPTPWSLSWPEPGNSQSGYLAAWKWSWIFYLGFVLFPVWWIATFLHIPKTRRIGGGEVEKASVVLDDPQVEFDSRSWRTRCRTMAVISLFTYVPFIILVAVFAPR